MDNTMLKKDNTDAKKYSSYNEFMAHFQNCQSLKKENSRKNKYFIIGRNIAIDACKEALCEVNMMSFKM